MRDKQDEVSVRMVFKLPEAKALDHAMASIFESAKLIARVYQGQSEPLAQARKGAMRLRQAIARTFDPNYEKDKRDEYVHRMQALTVGQAVKKSSRWSDEEKAYLLESDESIHDMALTLRRTFRGVKSMRKKLKQQERERAQRHARKRGPK